MSFRAFASALLLSVILSFSAFAAGTSPVATVNGNPITENDLITAKAQLAEALSGLPEDQRREQLIDYMITLRLVADEARKQKLDSAPDFSQSVAFATDKLLMEQLMRKETEKAVSPSAIKAFYNERVKAMKSEQEVRARHILVPTEEEAKTAIEELKKGKDFAEVAKALSKDPGSAAEGGDLGYFTKERMLPEFSKAAFEGKVGKVIPAPVKTQFGWHVIKVEDKRAQKAPEMKDVEPQIHYLFNP